MRRSVSHFLGFVIALLFVLAPSSDVLGGNPARTTRVLAPVTPFDPAVKHNDVPGERGKPKGQTTTKQDGFDYTAQLARDVSKRNAGKPAVVTTARGFRQEPGATMSVAGIELRGEQEMARYERHSGSVHVRLTKPVLMDIVIHVEPAGDAEPTQEELARIGPAIEQSRGMPTALRYEQGEWRLIMSNGEPVSIKVPGHAVVLPRPGQGSTVQL